MLTSAMSRVFTRQPFINLDKVCTISSCSKSIKINLSSLESVILIFFLATVSS